MRKRVERCRGIPSALLGVVMLLYLLVSGCATDPEAYPKPESTAIRDYRSTTLGHTHAASEVAHPGESGFALLRYGHKAFNARVSMLDRAEKSIDLQVYIWEADETGRIMAQRVLAAADRGVRVRILVDDLGFGGSDRALIALDAHPKIEVRVYNPFAGRKSPVLDLLTDLQRVNRRMHNKILIVDNSFAIVGGRNIGDHYFAVAPDSNFRDLDIAAVGPVVREVSEAFDYFWRGDWSVPAAAVVRESVDLGTLKQFAADIDGLIALGHYPYPLDADLDEFQQQVEDLEGLFVWAPGRIVWDDPAVTDADGGELISKLRGKLPKLQKSLTVESAYFVVGDRGVEQVKQLTGRGITVRVLTNSLVSNDVLAAHAGHAEFRKQLLEVGAEIYELRPDSSVIRKTWEGEPLSGLHTKALVFDDESVFVGSFNLDPRSSNINTEAGIYVESPELARQVLEYMAEGVEPRNSYKLELDESDHLIWITTNNGEAVRYRKDPLSTFGQRFLAKLIELLPVESQL
ncbi:phospholipase D family protein [Coraliomargarita parva]|uniref:phospholipase D family protein n=1 Tax=Coraliomargarita parva TaxID=3014050 RepID=UPI0022B5BC7F|nr:phospholipase D family protein [Coraliomargarita parva]